MLIGFLYTLFVILSILLILIILLQRSKGSLGIIGSAGSSAQMLFGGSGGHDFLKKLTWAMVAAFMGGSLGLALLRNWEYHHGTRYLNQQLAEATAGETTDASTVVTDPVAPVESPEQTTADKRSPEAESTTAPMKSEAKEA